MPLGEPSSTVVLEADKDTEGSGLTATVVVAVELDTPWLSVTTREMVVVPVVVVVHVGLVAVAEEKDPLVADQEYEFPPDPPDTVDVSCTVWPASIVLGEAEIETVGGASPTVTEPEPVEPSTVICQV